jgi:hypothetical protein
VDRHTLGIAKDDGFLAPDGDVKLAADPLARDEHRRQKRDLNDVKRMARARYSISHIVKNIERRSKAEAYLRSVQVQRLKRRHVNVSDGSRVALATILGITAVFFR